MSKIPEGLKCEITPEQAYAPNPVPEIPEGFEFAEFGYPQADVDFGLTADGKPDRNHKFLGPVIIVRRKRFYVSPEEHLLAHEAAVIAGLIKVGQRLSEDDLRNLVTRLRRIDRAKLLAAELCGRDPAGDTLAIAEAKMRGVQERCEMLLKSKNEWMQRAIALSLKEYREIKPHKFVPFGLDTGFGLTHCGECYRVFSADCHHAGESDPAWKCLICGDGEHPEMCAQGEHHAVLLPEPAEAKPRMMHNPASAERWEYGPHAELPACKERGCIPVEEKPRAEVNPKQYPIDERGEIVLRPAVEEKQRWMVEISGDLPVNVQGKAVTRHYLSEYAKGEILFVREVKPITRDEFGGAVTKVGPNQYFHGAYNTLWLKAVMRELGIEVED